MRSADPAQSVPAPRGRNGVIVLRMPAEVDLVSAGDLRDDMLSTLNREGPHLVMDAQDVTFMDSSGVSALVRARQRADQLDGTLHVVSTASSVVRVLKLTQLDRYVGLVDTLADALACLGTGATEHTCQAGF